MLTEDEEGNKEEDNEEEEEGEGRKERGEQLVNTRWLLYTAESSQHQIQL